MDGRKPPPAMAPKQHAGSSGRQSTLTTNNEREQLVSSFNQLSLAPQAALPRHSPSRTSSQSYRTLDKPQQAQHDPLAHRSPVPRRTPSINSLREDRRSSTPSLKKRLSTASLRSVQNSNGVGSPRPSTSRRASHQFLSTPGSMMRPISPSVMSECPSPPPLPTASSIAAEHFEKELALHQSTDLRSKTVVVLQDSCYGHRYSRPRTSKAGLESIVERPERLRAGVLGVASAYVRMGKRWGNHRCAPHPDLDLSSLPVPPFQILKTTRTLPLNSPAVTHVHGAKWMGELKMMCDAAESRLALNGKELVRPNSSGSDSSGSMPKLHEGDLYLCPESLNAFEGALGGVCEAIDTVFESDATRRAFVCIRPPGHHCSSNFPSGFCWLNNVHVGIAHAAMTHGLTHAAIIDFDLHHGDGSQAIAWEQNQRAISASRNAPLHKKTRIGYFSLHDINSYPCESGDEAKVMSASVCIDNAHGQSVWNVHLEPWKDAVEFWQLYNTKYAVLLDKARCFLRSCSQQLRDSPNSIHPKAAIFLSAGFDASEWEGIGMQRHKVNVPTDFYAKFTSDINRLAEEEDLAVDGRVISVLEGGYSDRALTSGIFSHLSALADTRNVVVDDMDAQSRLASEMFSRLNLSDKASNAPSCDSTEEPILFDTIWWTGPMLEELEIIAQKPPPAPIRKPREKGQPSFLAHTQASAAKAVTPVRERGVLFSHHATLDEPFSLPEVDWALAAVELSKAIIPTDRQTSSLKHADLKGENARSKRERHSLTGSTDLESVSERGHMQLRERKPKAPVIPELQPGNSRSSSRSTRRTTIASSSDLADGALPETPIESLDQTQVVVPQHSRKLSVTSSVASVGSAAPRNISLRKPREASSRPVSRAQASTRPATSMGINVQKQRAVGVGDRSGSRKSTPLDTTSAQSQHGDVDHVSNGVKKLSLKLKVPTPEEHAAREAARIAEERNRNMSKTAKKTPAAKPTKQTAGKSTSKTSRNATISEAPRAESDTTDPRMIPLPSESTPVSSTENSLAISAGSRTAANYRPPIFSFSAPYTIVTLRQTPNHSQVGPSEKLTQRKTFLFHLDFCHSLWPSRDSNTGS
ncbi:histone deacetylase HosB [Coccidioides immitis H538.4]|uniref:Histone deacetylase HosB n=1 Tax=Coccidioides immitis H538.4 TaxID=396776 RepID=A0A0J8S3H2_COCIT|nr:histone deacetylase HosB [Coccidioides immitis H538.4]